VTETDWKATRARDERLSSAAWTPETSGRSAGGTTDPDAAGGRAPERSLAGLLEDSARRFAGRPLLLLEGRGVSYEDFLAGVNGLAARLAEGGVERGDRVAAVIPNGPELFYLWLALARLGAVMVPLNPSLPLAEVAPFLDTIGITGAVGDRAALDAYGGRFALRLRMAVGGERPSGALAFATPLLREWPLRPVAGGDPVTILRTSGTTGGAKGAALTHNSYVLPAAEFVRWMEIAPDDRFLDCLPLFHLAGQSFAVAAIAGGASVAIVNRFSGQDFWSHVRRHGATVARHLGEMLAVLLKQPESADDRRHTLRAIYGGGARPDVAERFERRFGVTVVEGYGLTETNTVLRNEIGVRRDGSIGAPLAYAEVRIADASGEALPASSDGERRIGEIQVRRNPVMMTGYVGCPESAGSCFVGEWFRTGDLGYRDADGYFYFVSREKDVIRRRGENIVPLHVEEVLERHPAVARAAVLGIPDELGGEEVKAHLVCRPERAVDFGELVEWCRSQLAEFEVPRYFELCADLPRTSTNKVDKCALRRMAGSGGPSFDRKGRAEPRERRPFGVPPASWNAPSGAFATGDGE
jgi:crotonobetaine/carnitine-CoA ligase